MLELHDIRKTYHVLGKDRPVLKGIDATFWRGDAVGILGRNGAGKSTLMRIIAGAERPSAGRVERRMSVSWPMGYSGALNGRLSGADNCRFIARVYGRPADWTVAFCDDFAELGAAMRHPVETYSAGMAGRLAIALSLAVDFDCYLIDEVVAAGDNRFAERSREALMARRGRSAIILVSHQENLVRMLCTSAAVLNEGKLHFHEDLDQAFAAYRAL